MNGILDVYKILVSFQQVEDFIIQLSGLHCFNWEVCCETFCPHWSFMYFFHWQLLQFSIVLNFKNVHVGACVSLHYGFPSMYFTMWICGLVALILKVLVIAVLQLLLFLHYLSLLLSETLLKYALGLFKKIRYYISLILLTLFTLHLKLFFDLSSA